MTDYVVTVPKGIWRDWIAEGDAAGDPETGEEWGFTVGYKPPGLKPGDRLYIWAHGRLRGYAPVTRVVWNERTAKWVICRRGGAVAVTIPQTGRGFRGARQRWWERSEERPFPGWKWEGVK